jgi:hypothetical protein
MGSAFNATTRQIGAPSASPWSWRCSAPRRRQRRPPPSTGPWSVLAAFGLASGLVMLSLFRPPARRADTAVGEGPLAGAPAA